MRIEIKGVNPVKLHGELIAAGLLPADRPMDNQGDTAWIDIPDGVTEAQIRAIVAAHNPVVTPNAIETNFAGDSISGDELAKAFVLVMLDEVNRLRGWAGKPTVTMAQFRTAMRNKLNR